MRICMSRNKAPVKRSLTKPWLELKWRMTHFPQSLDRVEQLPLHLELHKLPLDPGTPQPDGRRRPL
jgi:hypothetical protein